MLPDAENIFPQKPLIANVSCEVVVIQGGWRRYSHENIQINKAALTPYGHTVSLYGEAAAGAL